MCCTSVCALASSGLRPFFIAPLCAARRSALWPLRACGRFSSRPYVLHVGLRFGLFAPAAFFHRALMCCTSVCVLASSGLRPFFIAPLCAARRSAFWPLRACGRFSSRPYVLHVGLRFGLFGPAALIGAAGQRGSEAGEQLLDGADHAGGEEQHDRDEQAAEGQEP